MDRVSFEQVYRDYYLKVFRYVKQHTLSRQDAEDLTQEVFVACYRNFNSFDPQKASVGTWVYVIMKNRLKNYYRDKKEFLSLDDENIPELPGDTSVAQAILLEEERQALSSAMNILSERERTIIAERYFHKKTSGEIAGILKMTDVNVRVTLKRALEKIRKYFEAHGL